MLTGRVLKYFFLILFLLPGIHVFAQEAPAKSVHGANVPETGVVDADIRRPDIPNPDFSEPVFFGDPPVSQKAGSEDSPPEENRTGENGPEENIVTEKKKFRVKNRIFELSLFNLNNAGFANNFLAYSNIMRDPVYILKNLNDIKNDTGKLFYNPIEINIDDFISGFKLDFGMAIEPLSLNYNHKDKWGFGLDIGHIDMEGNISLSDKIMTLSEATDEKFGIGAAVFVDFGIPIFFHVNELKIKLRPSVYLPVVYTKPGITYTHKEIVNPVTGARGTYISADYSMRIYSAIDFGTDEDGNADLGAINFETGDIQSILRNNLGYDLGLGAEYPLYPWLDLGVDIVNLPIPFLGARLNHYLLFEGSAYFDSSYLDISDLIDGNSIPDDAFSYPEEFNAELRYNEDGEVLLRPFKMLFYAHYRPFDTRYLTITPVMGFSINQLYPKVGAFEGGFSVCFDSANLSILTLGWHYMDRKFKNSIDYTFNLRFFALNLGLIFQSQNFVKSWQGAGLGINFGLKLGW